MSVINRKVSAAKSGPVSGAAQARQIKAHPKLIMDTIRRQAGTLAKAVLEGVMNAVDAKAGECRITITPTQIRIVDNGKGIQTLQEIENFFETFGYPHDESEGKIYAQFRMGRGQCFSFGKNTWRTGEFEMVVDVSQRGLDYDLRSGLPTIEGCEITIDLYEPLSYVAEAELRRDIKSWCRYMPIDTYIDEGLIRIDPASEKWTEVTEEAYIRVGASSNLEVFNLGAFTLDYHYHRLGTGGVVVTRKQLKVNFARNDIMSTCDTWKAIRKTIDSHVRAGEVKVREKGLGAYQVGWVLENIRQSVEMNRWNIHNNHLLHDWETHKIFGLSSGQKRSMVDLLSGQIPRVWCSAECGDRRADRVSQMRLAVVFSDQLMEALRVKSVQELHAFLVKAMSLSAEGDPSRAQDRLSWVKWLQRPIRFATVEEMLGPHDDRARILSHKELTKPQQFWLKVIQSLVSGARRAVYRRRKLAQLPGCSDEVFEATRRRHVIGVSDFYHGWTDGHTYVATDWSFLKNRKLTLEGLNDLAHLLLHEWCHGDSDIGTHIHSLEFYQEFHDACSLIGPMVREARRDLLSASYRKQLTISQLRQLEM